MGNHTRVLPEYNIQTALRGQIQDCSHTFPSGFQVLCGEACFSCVLPFPSTRRKESRNGHNRTKWCIAFEKLTCENSPALQEGIPCPCRAVAVAFPVSMTMKVQVVTVLEVI